MPAGFCGQCNGKCCTELSIYVTHRDIQSLARTAHVHPNYFIVPYEGVDDADYPTFRMWGKDITLGLARPNERCIFLMDISGMNRCGVQGGKPMVCAVYPFNIDEDDRIIHSKPYKCPEKYWPQGDHEERKARSEVNKFRVDYEEFFLVGKEWNEKHAGPKKEFQELMDFIIAYE